MKHFLFIFAWFCLTNLSVNAQTNTWIGAGANANWNNTANWSLNAVPTAANDVVIPTGFTVNLNVAGATNSIVIQGNSTFNMSSNLSILNASSFASNVTVNWSSSSLFGGGNLTNNGTIILSTGGSRYISGGTTLTNNGTVTMPSGGYFYLYDTAVFNNTASGVFDFQSDSTISYSGTNHNFINAGLIKKTAGDANSNFGCILNNTGIISVENGTILMTALVKTFDGGVYNVSTGSSLVLSSPVSVNNELTGVLDGAMNWADIISVATTATFNFTGTTGVTWTSSSLIGGGNLTNESVISLAGAGSRYISGGTTLTNNGRVTMPSGGYFYLYDTAVFNNTASGVFDFQSDSTISYSGTNHNFINAGLIKKTAGDANSNFGCILNNTGIISVENGTILMTALVKTFDGGVYNVSTGSSLVLSSPVNINNELTGVLNGAMNWADNISVATTATFNFTGTTGVTWTSSSLIGGGNLTNESVISLAGAGSRYISGETTLTNNGTVTMPSGGYFYLYDTAVFNNTASGVFDFQSDSTISYSGTNHNFMNAGLIKKTAGDATSNFGCILNNTGIISVENGTILMTSLVKSFDGGVYNVSTGSALVLSSPVNINDELTGVLNGAMNWADNISVATTATFNFTGTTGVTWTANSLIGGGTLTNKSLINLNSGGSRYISGENTTLINTGTITLPLGGYLYLYNNATIDNQVSGVIDFQSNAYISYSGSEAFSINNAGLIQKTGGTGVSYIYPPVTNSGTINASSGELEFVDGFGLTNTIDGIIKGTATIDLPAAAKFTNDGTFAPGASPGTLTVLGTYKSSSSSVLDVELNGLTAGTEHDVLAITGTNAIFEGDINVTLGFEPMVGNSFTIATVSGVIATKNLTTPFTADYDGFRYTFDVTYPNDKEVKLTISSRLDIEVPIVVTQNINVFLNASGNATITAAEIDNGSTDNFTVAANLIYSLDVTDFSCADVGPNTVTLTVTDEASNSATQTAIVTVVDDINPTLSCGGDVSVTSSGAYSLPDYITNNIAVASDNCSVTIEQTPTAGTTLANGTYTISFIATDSSENTVNCSFELTISGATDSEAPTVVTQNVTAQLDAAGNATVTAAQVDNGSSDNVTSPSNLTYTLDKAAFTCADVGPNTVTLTVTDEASNSATGTAIVTVVDSINPTVSCGADVSVTSAGSYSLPDYIADNIVVASDNCSVTLVQTPVAGTTLANGTYTISFVATDPSENSANCSFELTVNSTGMTTWFADSDSDGFGNPLVSLEANEQPVGYVEDNTDCDDTEDTIFPGATEICYDGILQNCDGALTDGCPIITSTLRSENCDVTLTSLNQVVRGNTFSQTIPNGVDVTGYRFRVTNLNTNQVRVVERSNYIFQLTYTDFAEYNTPYSVEVQVRLNQEWMEVYGAPCTITTPGVPNTVLAATSCGATLVQMNNIIRAVVVPSALNYEYNVALIEGGFPVATTTLVRSGASFNLLQLTGIPIKFAAEYSVTIRVQVPTSSGPQWSTVAGARCSVFTPAAPEVSIEGCGGEAGIAPANMNTVVYASPIGGATQYRFTLTDVGYNQVYTTPSRFFRLSNFNSLAALTPGGLYSVTVEVEIYGNFYAGKECKILVPGGAPILPITRTVTKPEDALMGEFKAVAYPNPFATTFSIDVKSNSILEVSLAIYDMTGRLLETRAIKADGLSNQTIGERYPSGVYNVIVNQGENTQTIRVVKQ